MNILLWINRRRYDFAENQTVTTTTMATFQEIVLEAATSDGLQYYEQMSYNQIWYKLGVAAYVNKPEKDLPDVVRIDKMWRNAE